MAKSMKTALITGITGQDGSYLAEFLLGMGYRVAGVVRRSSSERFERLQHIQDKIEIHRADLLDQGSLISVLEACQPDEVYNLAAQSFVPASFGQPILTGTVDGSRRHEHPRGDPDREQEDPLLPGVVERDVRQGARDAADRERRRSIRAAPTASRSSTATGSRSTTASPTASTRAPGSSSTTSRRAAASSSSRARSRAPPPASSSASITSSGSATSTPDATGDSPADYVRAMWLMLQQETPTDYVIATGECHTIRDLLDVAFEAVDSTGTTTSCAIQSSSVRPRSSCSSGDASRARRELGWEPSVSFRELIRMMVHADLEILGRRPRRPSSWPRGDRDEPPRRRPRSFLATAAPQPAEAADAA